MSQPKPASLPRPASRSTTLLGGIGVTLPGAPISLSAAPETPPVVAVTPPLPDPAALARTMLPEAPSFTKTLEQGAPPPRPAPAIVDLASSRTMLAGPEGVDLASSRTMLAGPEGQEREPLSLRAAPGASPEAAPVSLSPGSLSPVSLSPGSLSPASQLRSTVLPRVEMVGTEPRMVLAPQLRYQEERLLGEGGVGEVVRVRDNDIERTVALKRIKAEVRTPANVLRFMDEIRMVGRLEHPNIVPIHDVGVDDQGQFYFVMKYVNGETLETIIEKLTAADPVYLHRYPMEKRVQIFLGILEAIHYAHAQGVIHRDLKPANVMVGPYGEVVVMDWGLAKRTRGGSTLDPSSLPGPASESGPRSLFQTRTGSLLGTPAYMPPEQARGQLDKIDERSDIYSLSALFCELLMLRHYLSPKNTLAEMLQGILEEAPMGPTEVPLLAQGPVPTELYWFLVKGLAKDPDRRYQSVAEMIEMLGRRSEGDIKVSCPITMVKSGTRRWLHWVDAHPFLMVSALAFSVLSVLAGLGTSGYLLLSRWLG